MDGRSVQVIFSFICLDQGYFYCSGTKWLNRWAAAWLQRRGCWCEGFGEAEMFEGRLDNAGGYACDWCCWCFMICLSFSLYTLFGDLTVSRIDDTGKILSKIHGFFRVMTRVNDQFNIPESFRVCLLHQFRCRNYPFCNVPFMVGLDRSCVLMLDPWDLTHRHFLLCFGQASRLGQCWVQEWMWKVIRRSSRGN